MNKVNKITKQTQNRFLNLYDFQGVDRKGKEINYYVASRAENIEQLKVNKESWKGDAVIVYAIYQEEGVEKLVLIKQYRYSIDRYIYELPAGLVDKGESLKEAATRELKEETGLDLILVEVDEIYEKPFFTSVGMSDECCATIYGEAKGSVSLEQLEDLEDIEVVLADRKQVREILANEIVALPSGYSMLHFLGSEEGKALDFLKVL
ncbi:MAG: NUDIX hydrolase [Erysipelotrichaceae bacterium]|nr:NUDIX hydrolase [Erysipelotrichaceae bacterium]